MQAAKPSTKKKLSDRTDLKPRTHGRSMRENNPHDPNVAGHSAENEKSKSRGKIKSLARPKSLTQLHLWRLNQQPAPNSKEKDGHLTGKQLSNENKQPNTQCKPLRQKAQLRPNKSQAKGLTRKKTNGRSELVVKGTPTSKQLPKQKRFVKRSGFSSTGSQNKSRTPLSSALQRPRKIPLENRNKINRAIERSLIFTDVSFNGYSKTDTRHFNPSRDSMNRAAIEIQRVFRGYITRKYLAEIKFIIYTVTTIQRMWRGYSCRKDLKANRGPTLQGKIDQPGISEVLITPTAGKMDSYSRFSVSDIRITSQIESEKVFNSPRAACSPRVNLTSPHCSFRRKCDFLTNSPGRSSPLGIGSSPSMKSCSSPAQDIATASPKNRPKLQFPHGFETSFSFIEEFCLRLSEFLNDDSCKFTAAFIERIVALKKGPFRCMTEACRQGSTVVNLTLRKSFLSQKETETILAAPNIASYLQERYYLLSDSNSSQLLKRIQLSYLVLILAALQQSIWVQFQTYLPRWGIPWRGKLETYAGKDLLFHVIAGGLTQIRDWAEVLAGSCLDAYSVEERQLINGQRIEEMMTKEPQWDFQAVEILVMAQVAQIVVSELVSEVSIWALGRRS